MYLRFFRRVRILPNLWLNLSRGGVSLSVCVRGLRATFGKSGTRLTAGLPGSGLSVTHQVKTRRASAVPPAEGVGPRLLEKALSGE